MPRSPHTLEFKIEVAEKYLSGKGSYRSLAREYGVSEQIVRDWTKKYQRHGIKAFNESNCNAHYTKEFKQMCVEAVINGKGSVNDIVIKYNISDTRVLRRWIKKYNAHIELKDYTPNREVYMAESRRKTTIDERKEIVEYCIAHNYNYRDTAAFFEVSYSQVYSWVKKYNKKGVEGLTDKRGRHKADEEVDELERLRRENARLKRQLEEKDMLTELLKKVQEFERM